ncbi:unnamed protein product [Didymodactylos carnosus]|uniref:Uncharacterized protein n=1 Tax=Didymodactylos carnosus TaxID=1234261 RepID=A0A814R9V1_9BILA|nr:unnamed protein product [Didymodactylos carnosus]CAF1529027.1 unnamed protein product [Didymodactylos carnosus]CAF3894789.1 unnamed protein product [Didymodactylos carnosus]CAF4315749.1 unnamed protein product [Didymodactylos carnosus]
MFCPSLAHANVHLSSKVQFEDNTEDIAKLERALADLQQQDLNSILYQKETLNAEDRVQMAQYAYHPQHYLSTQPSHCLLVYKPQLQQLIPTIRATNVGSKRRRSPSSSHIYSSPSHKSS